jgi:type VI secretion system protein VasG
MVTADIRVLLERLNPVCTRALEAAVGSCVGRGHSELRWEHLLLALLDIPESEAAAVFQHAGIDGAAVRRALGAEMETLPRGSTGKPSFSPVLLELLEDAWTISTLRLGREAICSAALLSSAFERGILATGALAELVRPLEAGRLQRETAALAADAEESARAPASAGPGGASGPLERFCTDLTARAREGRLDPVLGRDTEIRQVLDILGRRRKNNPILVGEAGVGKTAIVEGLALRIAAGEVRPRCGPWSCGSWTWGCFRPGRA